MEARKRREENESLYKVYVTDSLRAAYSLNMRYVDMLDTGAKSNADPDETSEEIISRITKKIEEL